MTNKAFKEQFAPTFSQQMKLIQFIGSGLRYAMETETFLFVFTIEVNKHDQVSLFFGIQPRAIKRMGNFMAHNFEKISPQECELTIQLIPSLQKPFWNIGANQSENKQLAYDIYTYLHKQVLPIITKYVTKPDLLDQIIPTDINYDDVLKSKLYGMHPAGMPSRTAWMLAIYHEKKDINRAKAFARYGLEKLGAPTAEITPEIKKMLDEGLVLGNVFGSDPDDDTFFGTDDLKRIDKL